MTIFKRRDTNLIRAYACVLLMKRVPNCSLVMCTLTCNTSMRFIKEASSHSASCLVSWLFLKIFPLWKPRLNLVLNSTEIGEIAKHRRSHHGSVVNWTWLKKGRMRLALSILKRKISSVKLRLKAILHHYSAVLTRLLLLWTMWWLIKTSNVRRRTSSWTTSKAFTVHSFGLQCSKC